MDDKDIIAKMSLDDSDFLKGLSKAVASSEDAGKKMSGSMEKFVTATKAASVAVAAAGAAFIALAVKQANVGDELGKISDKFGIATGALSSFDYAAGMSGISTEGLASSLKFMQKSLADASQGSESQAAAFKSLGLNAAELINMRPDEAFKLIADRLSEVENPAIKAATAMDIFGRAGADIIPMIKDGADGLASMQAEADRFGLTISRIDASALEAANDAVSKIGAAANGAARQFAIGLAPAISVSIEEMMKGVDVADIFKEAGSAIGTAFIVALETISVIIEKLMIYFDKLKLKILEATKAVREFAGADTNVVESNIGFLKTKINRDETNLSMREAGYGDGLLKKYNQEVDRLDRQNAREKYVLSGVPSVSIPALDQATSSANKLAKATSAIGEAAKKTGDSFTSGFENAGNAIFKSSNKIDTLASSLQNLISNGLQSLFSQSSFLSPVAGDLANIASSLFGDFAGSIFGGYRANGGNTMSNGLYMVGERGPELLRMGSKQGYITSNKDAFGSGSSSSNLQVNVFNQAGVDVQTAPSQNGQGLDIILKKAVTGMVARGDLDSSMRGRFGLTPSLAGR